MIAKSLIAAAAIAAALTAFAPAQEASARTHIDIGIGFGFGGYGGYEPYPVYPVMAEPVYGAGMSCWQAKKIVKYAGYYNVQPFDCSAPVYNFKAWKWGNPYRVRVTWEGNIIGVKPL